MAEKNESMVGMTDYMKLLNHNGILQDIIAEQDEQIEELIGGDHESLTMREVIFAGFIALILWAGIWIACVLGVASAKWLGVV